MRDLIYLLLFSGFGFVIFILIASVAKKDNGIYFAIAGICAFLFLFSIMYDHPFVKGFYTGNLGIDAIVTVIGIVVITAVIVAIISIQRFFSEHFEYRNKAKKARMSVEGFKIWKTKTIEALTKQSGGSYDTLEDLYEEAEKNCLHPEITR